MLEVFLVSVTYLLALAWAFPLALLFVVWAAGVGVTVIAVSAYWVSTTVYKYLVCKK